MDVEIKVHPFDLDYNQIISHRVSITFLVIFLLKDSTYRQGKGVIRC